MNNKINIGGILFDNVDMTQALNIMEKRIKVYKGEETSFLCVANQDTISRIQTVPGLTKESINESFLTIPDGYSIIYAAKFLRTPLKERIAGPDLMQKFIEISAKKGYKIYFLGAKDGIAQKMAEVFLNKYPDLKISGIYSPCFGEFSERENRKMIDMVNKSKTHVLWVSFGCPKQEKWILYNKNKLHIPITVGIGAAFDFHSGNIKRAPLFMQNLGLEWFYRFLQEPVRLWKRYFLGGIRFVITIIKQKNSE